MATHSKSLDSINDLSFVAMSPNEIIQWYEKETDGGWCYYALDHALKETSNENVVQAILQQCEKNEKGLHEISDAPPATLYNASVFGIGAYAVHAFDFSRLNRPADREALCGLNAARLAILLSAGFQLAQQCEPPLALGRPLNIRGSQLHACYYPKDINIGPFWIRNREYGLPESELPSSANLPSIDIRNYYANYALNLLEADALIGATMIDPKGWFFSHIDEMLIPLQTSVKWGSVSQRQWRDAFNIETGDTRPGLARLPQYALF
jgi:hypothetical protein